MKKIVALILAAAITVLGASTVLADTASASASAAASAATQTTELTPLSKELINTGIALAELEEIMPEMADCFDPVFDALSDAIVLVEKAFNPPAPEPAPAPAPIPASPMADFLREQLTDAALALLDLGSILDLDPTDEQDADLIDMFDDAFEAIDDAFVIIDNTEFPDAPQPPAPEPEPIDPVVAEYLDMADAWVEAAFDILAD